jgi:glycosyltransferase involved in cell wall biosynthesis
MLNRDGIEGAVVAPDNADALALAIRRFAEDPASVAKAGDAARARVLDGYTEQAVSGAVLRLYRDLLA